jgi:hypothetical protein
VILALAVACGGDRSPSLRATVLRPQHDSVSFAVPAVARACSDARSLLLEGADEHGNGVLVRLRYGDSLVPGPFPLIALGDSITPRGASVAVRYMKGDVAHGLALDSGAVDLTTTGDALTARLHGSGLEGGVRVATDAAYVGVRRPSSADTISCRSQP